MMLINEIIITLSLKYVKNNMNIEIMMGVLNFTYDSITELK